MEYLITPIESTEWKINPEDLIDKLEKFWLQLELKKVRSPDDFYCLEWIIIIPSSGQKIYGALHRDLQGISLDGDLLDCATFAVWFRSLVPSEPQLMFYDQGFNQNAFLQENITESELIQPFLAKANA